MTRMTVTMMFRLASAVLLWSWSAVQGRPEGAPTCRGGTSAPGSFHRPTGFVEETIANGNLVVTVNGMELDTAAPLELFTGGTYEVVIAMTDDDSFFRGVMVRVDGGDANVDASTTLDIVEDDTDLQINSFCIDDEELVSGVTHTDNNDKMNVTFTMTLTEASTNMALDVNVVQTLSPSIFFYTRFFVHAVDPPAPTAVPTGMPTLAPTMQRTIYELASNAGLTIAALVDAAGLAPALNDPTAELTLLMPTEESFAALPERMVQYLTDNADTLLRFILLGHVVPQEVNATEVAKLDGQSVPFLNNVSQTVSVADNGSISITANGDMFGGDAAVIDADFYQASNGIIHVIDRILGLPNLSEVISEESSTLEVALNRAGLDVDSLSNITLFAPTTTGFLTLAGMFPDLANDVLTNDAWSAHMAGLLLAHAMDTVYMAEDLMDGDVITSITGDNYTVAISGNSTTLAPGSKNNVATVEETNGLTVQGVIHTIDAVLLPAWLFSTVYDVAKMETATLATLLEGAGLADTVANTPGITLFAPTDEAFATLPSSDVEYLTSDAGKADLVNILSYHVLPVLLPKADVEPGSVSTLLGPSIVVTATDGGVFLNGDAQVIDTDLLANNGLIHLISKVLVIPPSEAPTVTPAAAPTSAPTTSMAPTLPIGLFGTIMAVLAWIVL